MRVLFAAVLLGCGSQSNEPAPLEETGAETSVVVDSGDDAFVPIDPPVVDKICTEDTSPLLEPERGLMEGSGIALTDGASYASFRGDGYSLVYAKVRLDAFRDKPLDSSFLDALDKGFARVREAGIKVVLRFVYNDPTTFPSTDPDASQARILGHIEQLGPVLTKHVDVIAAMEAGFIGLWGEWHHSTNGLETPGARAAILDAILASLPPSRRVLVRAPRYKIERFPLPVEPKDVFGTSAIARIGHHNDCFLASGDDQGTYDSDADRTYLEADSVFLPVGGESCEPNPPRTECTNALAELTRFHWSFYNPLWHPDVWTAWAPCRDEITRRLGYRFVIDRVQYPPAVRPGGVIPIEIDWRNVGFASMWNDRPAKIVLDDGTKRWVAELTAYDVFHRVAGGTGGILVARLRVPASAHVGKAKIELWLPDASPSLADRPEYSVRIASKEIAWDAIHGTNVLAETSIDPAAAGTVDATATAFSLLP